MRITDMIPRHDRLPLPRAVLGGLVASCAEHVGDVRRVAEVFGGSVSHVYRVFGERGSAILKVRGRSFSRIPGITTDPSLIRYERKALRIFRSAAPHVFPDVLAFHREHHALVLEDVFPGGRTFEDALRTAPATRADAALLGATIGLVHRETAHVDEAIREDDDLAFRDQTLWFCLESSGHPALARTAAQYRARSRRTLVLGDAAPKNTSLAAGRITLCDLDNAHLGSHHYDVGYVAAHLVLHHLPDPDLAEGLVRAFRDGYARSHPAVDPDDPIVLRTLLGVCLYRLVNDTVPYRLALSPERRREVYAVVYRLLDDPGPTLSKVTAALKEVR
ncbi:hypothetical protein [Actinosynnema sp. NPDC023587]|uniref:hypothetical protein n=1 Tax=Actinosynnema sp. NPDC023587 TaxID=3154695 RepID=UPI0033EA92CC